MMTNRNIAGMLAILAGMILGSGGCGGEDGPGVNGPNGGGLVVIGVVAVEDDPPGATIMVLDGGYAINDATVHINDTELPNTSNNGFYSGDIPVIPPGDPVVVDVSTSIGSKSLSAVALGPVQITRPQDEAILPSGEPITFAWNRVENATEYRLQVITLSGLEEVRLDGDATSYTLPGDRATAPGFAFVIHALNGTGPFVSDYSQGPPGSIPSESGFYVYVNDGLTVTIGE